MRRRLGNMGPYPSDFTSDYQTDFKSDYRNWGSGKPRLSSEWVNEFKGLGTPFSPTFPVCTWEGGKAKCPAEYVKEFSGLGAFGEGKGKKLVCMALTLLVGIGIGYYLRHSEIIVLGAV